jgi:hypothetical protein
MFLNVVQILQAYKGIKPSSLMPLVSCDFMELKVGKLSWHTPEIDAQSSPLHLQHHFP